MRVFMCFPGLRGPNDRRQIGISWLPREFCPRLGDEHGRICGSARAHHGRDIGVQQACSAIWVMAPDANLPCRHQVRQVCRVYAFCAYPYTTRGWPAPLVCIDTGE